MTEISCLVIPVKDFAHKTGAGMTNGSISGSSACHCRQ